MFAKMNMKTWHKLFQNSYTESYYARNYLSIREVCVCQFYILKKGIWFLNNNLIIILILSKVIWRKNF